MTVFYNVDWEAHDRLSDPVLLFHATLNEEYTHQPADQVPRPHGRFDVSVTNTDWKENYALLSVQGYQGHYVGTGLNADCRPGSAGKWWEGDDMFVIDDEPWPPRLHGTGTEDYFNLARGFRQTGCRPEYGITYLRKEEPDTDQTDGRFSAYRFHINDPIPFSSSVAYWYGRPLT